MSINEIEVEKSSFSFQCWNAKTESDTAEVMAEMESEENRFGIDPEKPGFHDCEMESDLIRGYYSVVTPFDVEKLVDGMTVKVQEKRIESCEFWICKGILFSWGNKNTQNNLVRYMTPILGAGVDRYEFDCQMMQGFRERLTQVRSLDIQNPRERAINKAKISGKNIEDHSEVADPRNHMLTKVSGLLDTAYGPITVSVSNKGAIRLGVRRGFVVTFDLLLWLFNAMRSKGFAS